MCRQVPAQDKQHVASNHAENQKTFRGRRPRVGAGLFNEARSPVRCLHFRHNDCRYPVSITTRPGMTKPRLTSNGHCTNISPALVTVMQNVAGRGAPAGTPTRVDWTGHARTWSEPNPAPAQVAGFFVPAACGCQARNFFRDFKPVRIFSGPDTRSGAPAGD